MSNANQENLSKIDDTLFAYIQYNKNWYRREKAKHPTCQKCDFHNLPIGTCMSLPFNSCYERRYVLCSVTEALLVEIFKEEKNES